MNDPGRSRALIALMFFPRGGSAVVVRNLARFLPQDGWDVTVACASLGGPGGPSHAGSFFAGLDVRPLDLTPASEAADPLAADPPFHPSFEDRSGAPDLVFARLDDAAYERQVAAWARHLEGAGACDADVLHLNHLTPVNEAAARVAPDVPTVGHLHGTELLMLAAIERGAPPAWTHAEAWAERMRAWARRCDRLLVLSPDAVARVPDLLGVGADRVVWAPNGFDPGGFDRRPADARGRVELWRRWLVDQPAGWDLSGRPGSVAYTEDDLGAFAAGGTVLLYVGRFTEVKRVPLLIRAHARARERFVVPAPLVLLGGHPGEWEGPHPLETIAETGSRDVFLAGWHGHEDLPEALNAADLVVLASVHEQFGQVLVEGMACGLPAVAVDAHGPATIVEPGKTGWLVPPDDEDALVEALVEAVNDPERRRGMGTAARTVARERYAWPSLAAGVAEVYAGVAEGRPATGGGLGRLPDPTTPGAPRSP